MHPYSEAVNRVCEYIHSHLDGDLNLDQLAKVACISKFHFHRIFRAQIGLPIGRFISLARLRKAAMQLAFEDQKIIDVAWDVGFESAEAFSRAFKREAKQSPSEFKQSPDWFHWQNHVQNAQAKGKMNMQVTIKQFPETPIAYLSHRGPHQNILETASKFITWRKTSGLSPVKTSQTFGIPHSNPYETEPEDFRFDVAGSVEEPVPDNEFGVENGTIPGGRCAVVTHYGSRDNLEASVLYLYKTWLPESEETCRDYPCFFHYVNLQPEVDEADLITNIYLPLISGQSSVGQ